MANPAKKSRQARRQGLHQGRFRLYLLRQTFRLLGPLLPSLFSRWAYWLWTHTHRYPETARERRMRLRASEHSLFINNQVIKAWSWGDGPLVLLVHGWNGRGMQMAGFVEPLLKSGFQVMCFDAPGHGLSSGHHASLIDIRDVILHIGEQYGPLHAVIGHSFGVACLSASLMAGLRCRACVALSSPGGYQSLITGYAGYLQMPTAVVAGLSKRIHQRMGDIFWEDIAPTAAITSLPGHCLIVHDTTDKTVPWQVSEALAKRWPNAELFLTEGLGHRRILLSGRVARYINNYLENIPLTDQACTSGK